MNEMLIDNYLDVETLPHLWCPGCGNGIVIHALLQAIDDAGINREELTVVSGIGCSSRAVGYLKLDGMHTLHGRAIAFATGIKMVRPESKIIVLTGDGDCASIGGNHFIHAARRNIDLSVIVFNNENYGMTGGQYSPTTPIGKYTKTSLYGSIEQPLDICRLAETAGATYVARSSTYHFPELTGFIKNAILHNGFSVVEALCDCPTCLGRLNDLSSPADMLKRWKDICIPRSKTAELSEEELNGKIVTGEFINRNDRIEYTERYRELKEIIREQRT